ncbi:MAG TPA: NAD(P)H-dependent oxidoreductase [Clostridia bacterium]|nr:NAD(P)H-dependent oxidoreductase [Clostridia bacterium]
MIKLTDINEIPVRVLLLNGSPRKKNNSGILLEKANETIDSLPNTETRELHIFGKHYDPANTKDDFAEFLALWRWADAIVLSAPIYTAAGPGILYHAFDRLATELEPELAQGRYEKAGAVIMQGSETYGMVELGLENAIELFSSLHVIPAYRLAGRVPDKEQPQDERLFAGARELGKQVVDVARILRLASDITPKNRANLFVINAGVDQPEIGDAITARIVNKLSKSELVSVSTYRFAGKRMEGCHHCNQYCYEHFDCVYKDGFQEFKEKWLQADGILWVSSSGRVGPPTAVRCALDRLSENGFSTVLHRTITQSVPYQFAKYRRPEGVIAYDTIRYGGQSLAQQFYFDHAVLRGNLIVTGSDTNYPLGPAAFLRQATQLGSDQFLTDAVDRLTQDIERLTARVLAAKYAAYESLSEEYFPARTKMGLTDKPSYEESVSNE